MYYFCVYPEDIIKMLKKKNLGGKKPPRRRRRRCLCPEPVLVAPWAWSWGTRARALSRRCRGRAAPSCTCRRATLSTSAATRRKDQSLRRWRHTCSTASSTSPSTWARAASSGALPCRRRPSRTWLGDLNYRITLSYSWPICESARGDAKLESIVVKRLGRRRRSTRWRY